MTSRHAHHLARLFLRDDNARPRAAVRVVAGTLQPLIGWWGVAQLVMAAGIAIAAAASATNSPPLSVFGQATDGAVGRDPVDGGARVRRSPARSGAGSPSGHAASSSPPPPGSPHLRPAPHPRLHADGDVNLMAAAEFTFRRPSGWCRAGRRSCF